MNKIPVDREVLDYLDSLMEQYKTDMREIASAISEAVKHGDLRENSEFESAKQKEAIKKAQIAQLEKFRESVTAADPNDRRRKDYGQIDYMRKVGLQNMKTGEREEIFVVVDALGDVGEVDFEGKQLTPDRVSGLTPFGKTLMGKAVDSIVKFGEKQYKITSIESIDYSTFF